MQYIKHIKTIVYTCLALIFLISVHLASVYFFAAHQFQISYDPLISSQTASDITTYINNYPITSLSFKQLEQSLQKDFACVASIQASAQPHGIIKVYVDAIKPLCVVDDKNIITAHNSIINADFYSPDITQRLPALQISLQTDQKRLPSETFAYLASLYSFNIPHMEIIWKQPHDVQIHLLTENIKIRCNAYTTPDQQFFDRCIQIAREHQQPCIQAKKVLADIRFDNQVIISKIKKLGESL